MQMILTDNFLDTSELKSSLKGRAVRGGFFTLGGQVIIQMIRFGSTVVLARLLIPKDFGLIAMITAITGFMMLFSDLGLSHATIQHENVTNAQISNLFWINLGLGILATLVIIMLAPVMVWFYNEPRLLWLIIALSFGFIFAGLTVQHQALLQRKLRFGTLVCINIATSTIGIFVGVALALLGAGVWSLVCMQLAISFSKAVSLWIICSWRPALVRRNSGVKSMLKFGGNLTGFNIVNYFSRNLDNVLIGWYWGAVPLGLYNRAYALLLLPLRQITTPVSSVAIPTLSRLQNDPQRYRRYYLKAISLIASITMPAVMFLIVMSDKIINLVLGERWAGASGIFTVLGITALIQPVLSTTGWLFVSTGRTDRMFRVGLIFSICISASFLIGLPFGTIGVAAAYAICTLLLTVPCFWYSCKTTPVSLADIFNAMWRPALAALTTGAALIVFRFFLPNFSVSIGGLMICIVETLVIFLGVYCLLERGLTPLFDITNLVRQLWQ